MSLINLNASTLSAIEDVRIKKEQVIIETTRELVYFSCIIRQQVYNIDISKLHTILTNKIEDLMFLLSQNNFPSEEISQVRYLICAALDEAIVSYTEASEFLHYQSLTSQYYKGELGGIYFFQKLEELEKNIQSNSALLTLGLIILCTGFKGQYAIENDGLIILSQIKNRIYFTLKRFVPKTLQKVTQSDAQGSHYFSKKARKLIFIGMILIILLTYFVTYLSLYRKTEDVGFIIKEIFEL